jgi:hypothetical protein
MYDAASLRLPKNLIQASHRNSIGTDQVFEHVSGSDRGKLVYVSDKNQMAIRFNGLEKVSGKSGIQHGRFVNDYEVGTEWFRLIDRKRTFRGVELQ